MRISINTLYCINYISHFTNVIWGNGDGKYENLNYHCVLIKWKEAWESAGSAAGRASCPHRLFGGAGRGGLGTPNYAATVATSIKAVLQEGLKPGLRHNI